VALDQLVLTPIAITFFYTSMAVLEGKGLEEGKRRVNEVKLSD
jgi:hypothetical protein